MSPAAPIFAWALRADQLQQLDLDLGAAGPGRCGTLMVEAGRSGASPRRLLVSICADADLGDLARRAGVELGARRAPVVVDLRGVDRAGVARNAPCPCGGPRKFKHCHLNVRPTPTVTVLWCAVRADRWPPLAASSWLDVPNCGAVADGCYRIMGAAMTTAGTPLAEALTLDVPAGVPADQAAGQLAGAVRAQLEATLPFLVGAELDHDFVDIPSGWTTADMGEPAAMSHDVR